VDELAVNKKSNGDKHSAADKICKKKEAAKNRHIN
jgi:hypothetical protein